MQRSFPTPPLLIAGPTASGKSAYALRRAAETPSVIINADSMQVYADLSLITARPAPTAMADIPHALFGHVDGADVYSAGRYAREVAVELTSAADRGLRPIIVGGTGLYFHALLTGLSPIPEVPMDIRERWRALVREHGAYALYAALWSADPVMAARLEPNDAQRIVRALEVHEATGRSLAAWQEEAGTPLLRADDCERRVVVVERDTLNARADARFDQMMAAGGLAEVARLLARGLPLDRPVMRALGVRPLADHLAGRTGLETAVASAKRETRGYIKRQRTWLKRNMSAWQDIDTQ